MKLQTIFNRVKKHLLEQNKKAINLKGNCQYLHTDGLKCAVGCLINKKYYKSKFEEIGIIGASSIPIRKAVLLSLGLKKDSVVFQDLLTGLQSIHDQSEPERWEIDLQQFEINYKNLLKEVVK